MNNSIQSVFERIHADEVLSPKQKKVGTYIADKCGQAKNGEAIISHKDIARDVGVYVETAMDAVVRLVKRGYFVRFFAYSGPCLFKVASSGSAQGLPK